MTATLEWRKARRTGLLPAGLGGCALAAAAPICNMALRAETYLSQPGGALQILLDANWPVMAMIHALLIVLGASLFYHIEFAGNAMVKMRTLPLRETSLFLHKFAWLAAACACALGVEFLGLGFCARHWFGAGAELAAEVAKNWGFSILMLQPALSLALLVSSACRNLWVSLGVGVIFLFVATLVIPLDGFAWTLWPFALPFQALGNVAESEVLAYGIAAVLETLLFCAAEGLVLRVRRHVE